MAPSNEKAIAYIKSVKALPKSEQISEYLKDRTTIIKKGYDIKPIDKAIGYKPTGYFENQLNRFQAFGGGAQKSIADIGLGTARLVSHVLPEPLETKAQNYLAKQKQEEETKYAEDVLKHGGPRPATSYGAFAPDLALILGTFGGGETLVSGARGLAGLAPKVAPVVENASRFLKVAKIGEKAVTGAAKWAIGTYGYEAVKKGTGAVPAKDVAIGAGLGAAEPLAGALFKGGAGFVLRGLEKSTKGAQLINALDHAIFSTTARLETLGQGIRNQYRTLKGTSSKGLNILAVGEAEPIVGVNKQGVRDVVGEKLNPTPSLTHVLEPVAPHNGKIFVPKKTKSVAFDTDDLPSIADEATKQEHIGELITKNEVAKDISYNKFKEAELNYNEAKLGLRGERTTQRTEKSMAFKSQDQAVRGIISSTKDYAKNKERLSQIEKRIKEIDSIARKQEGSRLGENYKNTQTLLGEKNRLIKESDSIYSKQKGFEAEIPELKKGLELKNKEQNIKTEIRNIDNAIDKIDKIGAEKGYSEDDKIIAASKYLMRKDILLQELESVKGGNAKQIVGEKAKREYTRLLGSLQATNKNISYINRKIIEIEQRGLEGTQSDIADLLKLKNNLYKDADTTLGKMSSIDLETPRTQYVQAKKSLRMATSVEKSKNINQKYKELKEARLKYLEEKKNFKNMSWYNVGEVSTPEEAKLAYNKFNLKMKQLASEDPESYKDIQEFKARFRAADDWLMEYVVKNGARTPEEFALMKEKYSYHVSMKRILEIPESEFPTLKSMSKRALARRSAKGSKAPTVSPTAQYAEDVIKTIDYVDKNKAKTEAIKLVMEQGVQGEDYVVVKQIKRGMKRIEGKQGGEFDEYDQLINKPEVVFESAKEIKHPGDVTFSAPNPADPTETLATTIRLKDTLLAESINQTPVQLHPAINTMLELGNKYYRKNFQKLITSMPGFMIRNQIRDPRLMLITNPLMGQTGIEVAGNILPFMNNYMKAIGSISGGNTEKFLAKFGFKSERDIGNLLIQAGTKGGGYWEEFTKTPELARERLLSTDFLALSKGAEGGKKYNPLYWVQRYGHITESTPRRVATEMELSKLMKDGINVKVALREAAAKHHTSTADFGDMGKWARIAGKLIPFGTSGLAGMSLIGNAIKNNPEGVATRMFYTATLPALLMWFRVKDEPWYQAISQEEKNVYFYISEHVRIPKTWDSDAIAITIPVAKLDAVNKDRPQEVTEALRSLVQTFLPSYTIPVVSAAKVATEKNPKHPYWGTPIEPKYSEDKASVQKYTANTSETAKSLSWALRNAPGFVGQLSPAKIDAIVSILTGPVGKAGLVGMDWISSQIKMATGKKMVKPASTLNDIPGISAIIRNSSLTSGNTQQVKDLYDLDAKIKEINGKLDEAGKKGTNVFEKEYSKNKIFSRKILNDKNEIVDNPNVKLVTDSLKYIKDLNKKKLDAANPMTLVNPDTKKAFTSQSKLEYINELTNKINEAALLVVKEIRSKEYK